ncbi:MAG: helix-turn-helix transcriptional regulator [Gemmatimonas sp.]
MSALLDVVQAAHYLGLGRRTLENWRCRGDGPPFLKIGRTVRYCPADLSKWLDERRYSNTSFATVSR